MCSCGGMRLAVLLTGALGAAALTAALYRTTSGRCQAPSAAPDSADLARDQPLAIRPLVRGLLPVRPEDEEWLRRQIPPLDRARNVVSLCLHTLRVHGLEVRFAHPELNSSAAMLELLTDEEAGRAYFGSPALVRTRTGIRYPPVVGQEKWQESHRDQVLASFAELGIPLSHPLRLDEGTFSVRDVLRDSIANFHLRQEELVWTALAYALYLPPQRDWVNRYGERTSFDELVNELLVCPLDKASCVGTHLLYVLIVLARVDQQEALLDDVTRERLWQSLRETTGAAIANQWPDGSWSVDWYKGLPGRPGPVALSPDPNTRYLRLLTTGHLAEFLLYLPAEHQVHPSCLKRAASWLYEQLRSASRDETEANYCPYAHAACALRQLLTVPREKLSGRKAGEMYPQRGRLPSRGI
jgi:hypothetical protein